MRRVSLLAVAICGVGVAQAVPLQAQTSNASVARPQISHPPLTASRSANATLTPYERLVHSLHPVRLHTAAEAQAAMNGQLKTSLVELKGQVAGMMKRGQQQTIVLRVENANILLAEGTDFEGQSALHTGAVVRLIAHLNPNADAKEELLSIFAATAVPEPIDGDLPEVQVVTLPPRPQPLGSQPTTLEDAGNGLITPQGGADMILPQSQPSQPLTAPRGSSRGATSGYNYDGGDNFEAQKPSYAALVRRYNKKLNEAQVDEIATALLTAGYENNIDPRFLAAIIAVESDFDIYCISNSGAMGLGQLMPFNVKEAGITNPWSPSQNVLGTARLLRGHLNDYRNRPNGTLLAVAAYNAGPGAVRRAGYQVPPGQQVQHYVWKVYYRYKEFAPDMFR